MRKFCFACAALVVPALASAQAFGDSTTTGTPGAVTLDPKTLVWMVATSLGGFLVGLAIKKWPALDSISNRLIPYAIGVLAAVGNMVVLHVGLVDALLMAGASSYGAVLLAEGPLKRATTVVKGGAS